MNDPILDSILFLARYRRAPIEATAAFRRLKHNSDILPKLQVQLEKVLRAHGRFREVIYDTQGIRDDGVDALVRIPSPDPDDTPQLIGFQVKSFDDIANTGYLKDLKAQHSDATRKVSGLVHYFIILCTDVGKHRERIRSVETEFKSTPRVDVIEPQYAYTLLEHPETLIDAVVKRMVESSDSVFRDALAEVATLDSPTVRALVIYLVAESVFQRRFEFEQSHLFNDRLLEGIYTELREKQIRQLIEYRAKHTDEIDDDSDGDDEDFEEEEEPEEILEFQEQLAVDLDRADASVLRLHSNTGNVHLQSDDMRALSAVIADAVARFRYNRTELMNFAFDVMGIRD